MGWRRHASRCAAGRNTSCVETRAGPHGSRRTSPPAPWQSPAPSWPSPRPKRPPTTRSGSTRAPPGSHGQLTNGLMHNPTFGGFDDYGLSIDTALALDAGRRPQRRGRGHRRRDRSHASASYISTFGGPTTTQARSAKALVLAQVAGDRTPTTSAAELVTNLEPHGELSDPIAGRIEEPERPSFGDFANTLGQAYAAHALTARGLAARRPPRRLPAQAAVPQRWLPAVDFNPSKTASRPVLHEQRHGRDRRHRDRRTPAGSQSATQNRGHRDHQGARPGWLAAEGRRFLGWWPQHRGLERQQHRAGSPGAGRAPADSEQAAEWLRAHQVTPLDRCNALGDLRRCHRLRRRRASGRPRRGHHRRVAATSGDARTAQAAAGDAVPAAVASAPLTLTGPAGFRKAGTSAALTTRGVLDGTQLCLNGWVCACGRHRTRTRGTRRSRSRPGPPTASTPCGTPTATRTRATVKVLGAKTLSVVTSKRQVKRGGSGDRHGRVV